MLTDGDELGLQASFWPKSLAISLDQTGKLSCVKGEDGMLESIIGFSGKEAFGSEAYGASDCK